MMASASALETITGHDCSSGAAIGETGKIDQHGAHRGTRRRRPDDRSQAAAESCDDKRVISQDAAAETDQQRRHLVVIRRAFHIAAKVSTATIRLSGRASPSAPNTRVKRTLWSKPSTLPSCTRNSSTAAMFWKPAMTGCGANLISDPSRSRPNRRLEHAAEQDDGKEHQQRRRHARLAAAADVTMQQRMSSRPRKKVVVMRGAYTRVERSPSATQTTPAINADISPAIAP